MTYPRECDRVRTLAELGRLADAKKAVYVPGSSYLNKHVPAAWMIHLPGCVLLRLFAGMYLYILKSEREDHAENLLHTEDDEG